MAPVDESATAPDDASGAESVLRLLAAVPGRRDDAVAIVNGLFGDALDDRDSRFATPMTIRAGEIALPLDRHGLAKALTTTPIVGPNICVLVHGLMSTESIWQFPDDPSMTYGTLLADDHELTVLSLRYNTGRHISTNGRELADVLNHLVAAWPVRVRQLNPVFVEDCTESEVFDARTAPVEPEADEPSGRDGERPERRARGIDERLEPGSGVGDADQHDPP